MSLHDDLMGRNVKCDYCSNHVHMPQDDNDPRLDPQLTGWFLELDQRNFDICPDCVQEALEGDG